ncbi:response regulator [Bacteriovorax sp. Seq25_V]|uniref:response regulator n=1 Tax=Bacteriovorax sp. Seq25_V TaxID=1201288 RepID=UPI00038A1CDB|nr:response regulator [Bacteriovorax sp. Seq25_V]EQC45728.1 response regulator receiver domain protein [Bacteriovorax sp. Seq25_V]
MKKFKVPITSEFKILHLEDLEDLRVKMKSDLVSLGVEATIVEAEDVATAIAKIESEKIDFIISDWNLPDGTGFDFLKKVRSISKLDKVPFIMCTTLNEVSNMLDAISNGANEFITKPWELEELEEKFSSTYSSFYE